ncbi:MAG: transglutaminase domain-containing protein [Planctomycetia bacterium]|nr:transglutaminase domain-containing protein [Planctomycetia bacterium]
MERKYVRNCALAWLSSLLIILTSGAAFAQSDWEKKVVDLINANEFSEATSELVSLRNLTPEEQIKKDWYFELMRRIRIEFRYNEEQIREQLTQDGYEPTPEKMRYWEEHRYLEMRAIDGERRYFKHASPNLRRLDPELRAKRVVTEYDKQATDSRLNNCASIIAESDGKGSLSHKRVNHFTCVATLPANTVPEGTIVRYWAPFPRESCARQQDVKLTAVISPVERWELSPADDLQRTLYMEKKAVKDEDVVFKYTFDTTSYAQYFSQEELINNVKPYDENSEVYKTYTAEYLPHMIKTDAMKAWAEQIVGDETNPVKKVSLLFDAIDAHYPWASSNEYGTMTCIPEYVLREGHGDCGMLTLLLVSACRCVGVPAKWQSGWVMRTTGACGMHDWGEVYYEGFGWVPIDMSYGLMQSDDELVRNIYKSGLDQYRLVINDSIGRPFFIPKEYFRSEPVDLQSGEMETAAGNLYFNKWNFVITVETE